MREISVAAVCGIAAMIVAGAGPARSSDDLSQAASAGSLRPHVSMLSASSRNAIRLNTPAAEGDLFANAMKRTSGGTSAALKSASVGAGMVNGQLARAPAAPASPQDSLLRTALPSGEAVSAALKAYASGSDDGSSGSVNPLAGAGLLMPMNVGKALGAARAEAMNPRLGK